MNYLEVYFSRVNHFGETTAERIKNSGIVAFEKWMAQSPFTVMDLSVERGYYFSGIIETSKDKEEKKIMYLYVANDIPIVVGDILTWRQDNGVTEKWLLLQQIHKVHPQYQTFQIIKCNYELKWIDFNGYLRKSWAYAVSSVDSKVKSNFRMWHSLVSPQPNKFAEVIMPRPIFEENSEDMNRLMRGITFIIENEGWTIIECDWTSVEGIAYMSLTESKVNYQYDDRVIDVAETDRLKFPTLQAVYNVDDEIIPEFTEATFNEWEIVLEIPEDSTVLSKLANGHLQAIGIGKETVKMYLKNLDKDDIRKAVEKTFEITVNAKESTSSLFIFGDDTIRLDRYATYMLMDEDTQDIVTSGITFSVVQPEDDNKWLVKSNDDVVVKNINNVDTNIQVNVLHANWCNRIGEITLNAEYQGNTYTKTVKVIPLW